VTVRQRIAQLLKQGEFTAKDLSRILGIREKEVYEHLPHVERSARNSVQFIYRPASCLDCDFVFKKRRRFTRPGRCPVCRSERISEPAFRITEKTPSKMSGARDEP
jgi:predicted Zn-ribbon and HTH transcriptional regulator